MLSDRWFRAWQRQPAPRLRLFCLPYAGGQANVFADWAGALGKDVEVRALQLPGRGARFGEPAMVELGALLDVIEPQVMEMVDAPFAFFGHSMGAMIAFELARRLRRRGVSPTHLLLSSCRTPERLGESAPLHRLPDRELLDELRALGGTPDEVFAQPELLALVLPWVRADLRMLETWISPREPAISVPVIALGGGDDAHVSREDLALWRDHAAGSFDVQVFDGDHFYLHDGNASLLRFLTHVLSTTPASR